MTRSRRSGRARQIKRIIHSLFSSHGRQISTDRILTQLERLEIHEEVRLDPKDENDIEIVYERINKPKPIVVSDTVPPLNFNLKIIGPDVITIDD